MIVTAAMPKYRRKRQSLRDEAEHEALESLAVDLQLPLEVAQSAFNLISLAQSLAPDVPVKELAPARLAGSILLARLANELRSVALLAARGYALQAASLAASAYEVAVSITAMSDDDRLATKWLTHDDPTRLPIGVQKLTEIAVEKWSHSPIPLPEDIVFRQYRAYSQLSMAKHANPLLQVLHGSHLGNGEVATANGPDTSEKAVQVAWFALEQASGLTMMALCGFLAARHLPVERSLQLLPGMRKLKSDWLALNKAAARRWGTEDPHPGKWRR